MGWGAGQPIIYLDTHLINTVPRHEDICLKQGSPGPRPEGSRGNLVKQLGQRVKHGRGLEANLESNTSKRVLWYEALTEDVVLGDLP